MILLCAIKPEKLIQQFVFLYSCRYTTSVAENTSTKAQLMVIQPVGLDSGNHVTFILLNNKYLFSVGQTSGVVSTNGLPLDRERKDNYTLVVRVRDYFIYKNKL